MIHGSRRIRLVFQCLDLGANRAPSSPMRHLLWVCLFVAGCGGADAPLLAPFTDAGPEEVVSASSGTGSGSHEGSGSGREEETEKKSSGSGSGGGSAPAPTWTYLFDTYLAIGTIGDCNGSCHQHSECDNAMDCYNFVGTNVSILSWEGGFMPPSVPTSAQAKKDFDAWVAAGSKDN
jgi:hypothetical protein